MHSDPTLIVIPILTIGLLVLLITRLRLTLPCLDHLGRFSRPGRWRRASRCRQTLSEGLRRHPSSLGLVVGLGTMLGGLLLESGGADKIATVFVGLGPRRWIPTAICGAALLIGMPHLFDVSFVMLVPLLFVISKRVDLSIMSIGIPMVAGLLVSHSVLPPHPAPTLALMAYHADAGRTIFYGLLIAIPMAFITGPLFSWFLMRWCPVNGGFAGAERSEDAHGSAATAAGASGRRPPWLLLTITAVLLPPGLMMLRTFGRSHLDPHGAAIGWLQFIGDPIVSLFIAVMFAFYALGIRSGLDLNQIQRLLRRSVAPAAGIILILGAGGGLKGCWRRPMSAT